MGRLAITFIAGFFLVANCANAQAPGEGKASLQLLAKMSAGTSQDLIVVYDDKVIQERVQTLQSERGLPSHHSSMIELKAARYAEKKQEVLSAFGSHEATVLKDYSHLPLSFVRIYSKAAFDRLLAHPGVVGVYENRSEQKSLAESLPIIGQHQVAAQGNLGAGTAVAVLDTGADYTQPAFGSCTSPGVPTNCKVVYAHDFAPNDGQLDNDGHGTNVAGIVLGVAPGTKIVALDVFSGSPANGDLSASSADIIAAINWVIANKATYNIVAINLSLGSDKFTAPVTSGPYNSAVNQARASGILTIAAAGNDAYANALSQPAATTGVISVGAVYDSAMGPMYWGDPLRCQDATTAADKVTCFSNSSSFLTMLAPGSQILAAGITEGGTSQATPHVAGAVAVLRAAFPGENLDQTVARLTNGVMVTDSRNDTTKPRLNLQMALGLPTLCTYSISETSKSYSSNSSSGSIAVIAGAGCSWGAASSTNSASWIAVTSGSSGSGNGTVNYFVSANANIASRTGTITVAGQTVTVSQSGSVGTEANILLNPGFESGPVSWTDHTANGYPVITTYLNPIAGNSWYAWLCGYDNCVDSIYQDVTIPADAQGAYLQFNYEINTSETSSATAYDSMAIKIFSPPNASSYATCTPLSNLNATTDWVHSTNCNLIGYKGQTIRLQFSATTDSTLSTDFFLDDVTLMVSGAISDTQSPTVPSGLTAAAISTSAINLTWSASTDNVGVTTYKVYRGGTLLATLGNVTAYSNTGLTPSTSYIYTVSACDAAGNCSAQSTPSIVTTAATFVDTQPPTVPASLTGSAMSVSSINLVWAEPNDNMGVTKYKIYRTGTLLATLGAITTYSDTGLTPWMTYSYTVSACDAAGNCSAQSQAISVATLSPFNQATQIVIDGATSTNWSSNVVNISIAKIINRSSSTSSGSLRIELWAYATSYSGSESGYKTATVRTSQVNGLTDTLASNSSFSGINLSLPFTAPNSSYTHYTLFIDEYDPTNCPSSDHFCYVYYVNLFEIQPPTVPSSVTASAANSSQINLLWTAALDNIGVSTYKVYRGGILVALLGNVTSYGDVGLRALTTYSYTVSACDAAGNCSAQSSPASATTPAPPDTQLPSVPSGLTATVVSSTRIDLTWTASSDNIGVTAYKVYLSGTLVATLGNVTSSSRTNAPSSTYRYTVSACDAAGNCSAQSAVASATTPAISDTQSPTVPSGLTAAAISTSAINLTWSASTDNVGVTTYKVYRGGTLLATLGNVTSYGNTGLRDSTAYSYTVSACDAAGNCSAQSGTASTNTFALPGAQIIAFVTEFYKADINHYFMTASLDEAIVLDNKPSWGWSRTGKTFNIWLTQASAPSSASPVCRFFGVFANGTVGSHFYTADPVECANVKGRLDWGWGYENDAFYAVQPTGSSCPSGTSPVYRVYNNGMGGAPNHRYMANQADVSTMVSQGWVSEGTAFCGAQ